MTQSSPENQKNFVILVTIEFELLVERRFNLELLVKQEEQSKTIGKQRI
jgi:hypothetical protein